MDLEMKIAIGCDLAGFDFKIELMRAMEQRGYKNILDMGCNSSTEGDYPIYAGKVAAKVANGECERGIVICGTGQGVCMSANKVPGIRAALCYDVLPAILSREHNNSNILATGAWIVTVEKAISIIEAWIFAKYSGGRHDARIQQMRELESSR